MLCAKTETSFHTAPKLNSTAPSVLALDINMVTQRWWQTAATDCGQFLNPSFLAV